MSALKCVYKKVISISFLFICNYHQHISIMNDSQLDIIYFIVALAVILLFGAYFVFTLPRPQPQETEEIEMTFS